MTIVRGEVARLDGSIPVYGTHAMPDVVATSPGVAARRLLAAAFTAFALLAVALSATGLFGAVAHDVALRRVELAIRMALGASPVTILRSTLGQGVIMVAIGLGVGAVLSLWIVRALSTVVIVSPSNDLASAGLAAFVLLTTGLGAVLPAALRAARTDPQTVLRGE
jgi:ABC-type antimicrobial peptide transport system permease subunit